MTLESLEYVARVRARSIDKHGDDLPEDGHHDYTLRFVNDESAELLAYDNCGKPKSIPLTEADVTKMLAAFGAYRNMLALEADHA